MTTHMLINILLGVNIGITIANGFILLRSWRIMRNLDKLQAETWETLNDAIALRKRFEELNSE